MNAIVMNDLSMNTELDRVALAEIVGGSKVCYINGPWKYLGTQYYFKKWIKKGHKWYKSYLRVRKYKRNQYALIKDCVIF